MKYKN